MATPSSLESLLGVESLELTGFSPDDQEILQAPYSVAVRFLGHKPDEILSAVKSLVKQHLSLDSDTVLGEIDRLKNKVVSVPVKAVSKHEDLGSDGEADCCKAKKAALFQGHKSPSWQCTPGLCGAQNITLTLSQEASPKPAGVRDRRDILALKRRVKVLRSENRRLKERHLCKNCRSKPVSVTFLPCGHYSYCYDCGEQFSSCPLCQKTILADVKTFLA